MDAASAANVGTTETDSNALRLVNKRIQDLQEKCNLILQEEISLRKKIRKVLRSKYTVMGQIKELEKLSKEISSLQSCKGHLPINSHLVNVNVSPADADTEVSDGTESASCGAKRRRKVVELVETNPKDKERYLCVSNGITIFCLDLKQSKCQSFSSARDVPYLPIIDTLNLLQEHRRPILVGLFKLGSDVYVTGGKVPPLLLEDPSPVWCEDHRNSSSVTHRLSLMDGALTLSNCNIGKLKKPKLWPVVDKIDDQIHVFDTFPCHLNLNYGKTDWIFSHEVLTSEKCWINIPITRDRDEDCIFFGGRDENYITRHLVVGNRIYAIAHKHYFLFDSKMNKWSVHPKCECRDLFSVKQVWDILVLGNTRCAGEFPNGEPSNPLYVLITLGFDKIMIAVAYLVNSVGQVLCFQRLPHFFGGPVQPYYGLLTGTMINVDEDRKKMCAVISAHLPGDDPSEYLFISNFTVEWLPDDVSQQIWGNASEKWPIEEEFVSVSLKDSHVFKTDGHGEDDVNRLLAVQACFL